MLGTIKQWINWPTKGFKNINDVGNYAKANWLNWLALIIAILFVAWIVKKIFSFIANLFS